MGAGGATTGFVHCMKFGELSCKNVETPFWETAAASSSLLRRVLSKAQVCHKVWQNVKATAACCCRDCRPMTVMQGSVRGARERLELRLPHTHAHTHTGCGISPGLFPSSLSMIGRKRNRNLKPARRLNASLTCPSASRSLGVLLFLTRSGATSTRCGYTGSHEKKKHHLRMSVSM